VVSAPPGAAMQDVEHRPILEQIPADQDLSAELGPIRIRLWSDSPVAVLEYAATETYAPPPELGRSQQADAHVRPHALIATLAVTMRRQRQEELAFGHLLREQQTVEARLRADHRFAEADREPVILGLPPQRQEQQRKYQPTHQASPASSFATRPSRTA